MRVGSSTRGVGPLEEDIRFWVASGIVGFPRLE